MSAGSSATCVRWDLLAGSSGLDRELLVHVLRLSGGAPQLDEGVVDQHLRAARLAFADDDAYERARRTGLAAALLRRREEQLVRARVQIAADVDDDLLLAALDSAEPLRVQVDVDVVLCRSA